MNWVQVYRDDVIASIFGTSHRLWSLLLAGLETASLELNAHLRVQPAHCVYDFYIVPGTDVEGMRKIKHLTVSVASETNNGAFYWALVYVPQGTTPGNLAVNIITGTTGMYEPNQFVMNCGVVDPEAGPIRFTSPVSRNLNDGDAIYLLVKNTNVDGPITYNAVVRYAITPPMIITLHLKFNCIKFVGPVDVRSLTHRQGG